MRLLGHVRLSRDTDETTSPERQAQAIRLAAQVRGDDLVWLTEDLDVSGAVSPFERPNLGPWLKRLDEWDGLIVHKLDRLTRSLLDFANLIIWCQEHNKTMISVSESIDLATPAGRLMAQIIVLFAQFERERIGERVREYHQTAKRAGKFGGGKPPYGYMVVGKRLVPDPDTAPILRRIVAEIIGGTPLAAIARALTDEGVPTPKGAPVWRVTTLTVLVRSRALIGEMTHGGRPVRDNDGAVVTVTDTPLLTETEWAELEAAYAVLSKPHMVSHKADHMLLQVAFCGDCGAPLWHHHFSHRYNMYRCGRRCSPAVRAADLEALIEHDLLTTYGDAKIQRRAARSGIGVEQVAAAAREISELESDRYDHGLFGGEAGLARYRTRMAMLEQRLAELQEASAAAPGDRWQATGQTVAERWAASDEAARHRMLRHLGITWHVQQVFRVTDHAHRWQIASSWHDEETALERLVRTS